MCPAGIVCDAGETAIVKSPAPSVADPVFPVPPFVEVTFPVVLTLLPDVVVVTFTLTAHEAPAAIAPPLRLMLLLAAVAVNTPPQLLVALAGVATTRPAGKLSVTPTPLKAAPRFGLVIVSVRLAVPPTGTLAAPNDFAIDGGATTSRSAVLLVVPVPPSVELMLPVVLLFPPAVVPVTFKLILHVPPAEMLPLLRLMPVLPPTAPFITPPQVLLRAGD